MARWATCSVPVFILRCCTSNVRDGASLLGGRAGVIFVMLAYSQSECTKGLCSLLRVAGATAAGTEEANSPMIKLCRIPFFVTLIPCPLAVPFYVQARPQPKTTVQAIVISAFPS